MRCILTGRVAAIVAAGTVASDVDVIKICRRPRNCRVTVVACFAAGNMGWSLARRKRAIVARLAGTNHLGMVHHNCRRKYRSTMTILANGCGQNVCGVLTRRIATVVAGRTISSDANVIKIRRRPADCCMTVVAIVAACEVRRVLTCRNSAVVTGTTATQNLRVVDRVGRHPGNRVMAVFTDVGGLNMAGIFTCCIATVMASDAVAGNVGMIEICGNPTRSKVAVRTVIAANNVASILTRCNIAVMTRSATADDLRVVDGESRNEATRRMAILTNRCGENMHGVLSDRVITVVTGNAIADYIRVIKHRGQPCAGIVAIITLLAGRDVIGCLAGRLNTVVT